MKFTEGMWRLREGIKIDWMGNVDKITEKESDLKLLLTKPLRHRGDTLNSATLSTTITSPFPDIIGVKYVHWTGEEDKGPHFELNASQEHSSVRVSKTAEQVTYQSGNLTLNINTTKNNFNGTFAGPTGKKLTGHSFRSVGYVADETASPYSDGLYRVREGHTFAALDLGVKETLYGLGERFGPFVKNGQTVDMSNEDGGTSSEMAYKNIPFYLSSAGYGVFVNHPGRVSFEAQSERTTRVNMSVPGEFIEYFVVYGPGPKEIIEKYTALTGRPPVVPAWSYGLWLTTSFTTNYDEKTVTGFLDGFKKRNIPLGTFHFDCFWMRGFEWCNFEFDKEMFPDPEGYLSRLKAQGQKICVWINPYIGQESALFDEGKKNGYFVKKLDGGVWQWDNWQAGMALVDFTNPAACTWYASYLSKLAAMGVDAFKTDFGERVPVQGVKYHDGADPARMHNYYTHLYNKVVHEVLQNDLGDAKGCLFARSATAGGQMFPVHWGGDCESTFEAMAETLRGGLSLGLCGFGFWAHDIGGFEGTPSPTLYKRWCQFGLLSSHSRLHGSGSYRVPWLFDEECSEVLREAVNRKLEMMPYLLSVALEAHEKGTPMMRPTFMEYPEDLNTWSIDTQFFLGPNLLVAPVFTDSGDVSFYVPADSEDEGEWVSWFDHSKRYKGGNWYSEKHDIKTLPLLLRPGTYTAVRPGATSPEQGGVEGIEVLTVGTVGGEGVQQTIRLIDPAQPDRVEMDLRVESMPNGGVEVSGGKIGVRVL
ncbi:glycoside hydrolase family 31 protein [Aulographum hederae CBS 113979]|uniref:alpha-D-xyloside xylohydrolase n=1 Tax=Aulographum hederae CBS 113979 TaxID=1176131 RepID=A0A6G1HES3_9PEZI|nr:glycoside hydrolase family 31 protein [Aulographum hederae CBS 113979]